MTKSQDALTREMQVYLQGQLEADEKVLWSSRTNVGGRMRKLLPLAAITPFMILLCNFAFMRSPDRWWLLLLTVLIWLGIPILVAWRQHKHLQQTIYALTDRRAPILQLDNPKRSDSYPPERIEFVRPVVRSGNRGDVFFAASRQTTAQGTAGFAQRWERGFLDIADPRAVARLMRESLVPQCPSDRKPVA